MKLIGILGAGHIGKAVATQILPDNCEPAHFPPWKIDLSNTENHR